MSRVEPHPTDKGKFQATFDTYGHGEGNGKSRAAVYKHYKKIEKTTKNSHKENKATASLSNSTKSGQPKSNSTKSGQPSPKGDFVENENDDSTKSDLWQDISWLGDDDESGVAPTIPSPIRRLSTGDGPIGDAHRATQSQLRRWGYMGVDRAVTHWGRGVMSRPDWSIERHPADYEALEAATTHAMDANGLSIELSPTLVWGVVVAAAYAPPLGHIAKNSDPLIRRSFLRRFGQALLRPSQWFRRRRTPTPPQPTVEAPFHGNPFDDSRGDFVE